MDTLSHGLYGGVAVGRRSWRDFTAAFLFGVAPDILAFGPLFIASIFGLHHMERVAGKPDLASIPDYVFVIYDMTHSLVVYVFIFAVLWALGRWTLARLSLGWPLHILVDIPTHDISFFPTPFLWPISNMHVDGVSWAVPWIFVPNIILLCVLYSLWYIRTRKNRASEW
jgi:hypothetical protein